MNKPVIICVDDERVVLISLRDQLIQQLGNKYEIELAEGGEEALEILEELTEEGFEVPLIISDQIMPGMKGDELLIEINEQYPRTLKIMLTGQASVDAVGKAVNLANLYRYLAKPWQVEDLGFTVQEALNSYFQNKKLAEQNTQLLELNQALSRFVPNQFLKLLDKDSIIDIQLGNSVQKEMSILFADIRNFTTLSETMTPEDNFKFINGYLSRMEPAIIDNNGFIDKYIGDAIMALFGGNADDALQAGIAMLKSLHKYNKTRHSPNREPLKIGIGINTGQLMLGTIGASSRIDSTVISDAVNLASRLEGLTKRYGVSFLITQQTFSLLKNRHEYAIRFIDKVKVKGKSELVTIYEVFETDEATIKENKKATGSLFEQAWLLYNQQSFQKAKRLFSACLETSPQDKVAQFYFNSCSS